MAKRAAPDEQPYRPLLDAGLVSAAISNQATPSVSIPQTAQSKVLDMPRSELSRKIETSRGETREAVDSFAEPERRQTQQPMVEKFDQEKRILFTRAETHSIDRLVNSLATRMHAQVKVSHVMRALVALMLNAESEIDRRAGETGTLVRPPNGDALALQRFENQIASVIGAALRDAGPIR